MASVASSGPAHHHRSTTKSSNKPFKSRHATKSSLKEQSKGKIEKFEKGVRKTAHQQIMSKFDRRNQAKQHRLNKNEARKEESSVFAGRDGAPRIVAIVPLCRDVKPEDVVNNLNQSVDVEERMPERVMQWRVEVSRFKQRIQYLVPRRELIGCLDACRAADFVLFVLSADEEVDELGEQMLRCIEGQGVSTVLTGVHGLQTIEPAKRRPEVLKSLKSYITHFFATQEKVHDFSSRQECGNVMRSLCTIMPKGIRWREDRSWLLLDEMRWEDTQAVVTGVVRGKGLKSDRLVQLGDWGDFQIDKITAAPLEVKNKRARANEMVVDAGSVEQLLEQPTQDQDDLVDLAPEEITMDGDAMSHPAASLAPSERKAVLLDDHHYFHKNDEDELPAPKRLPRGTSKYQAAWYLGDVSDSGSDLEDVDDEQDGEMDVDNLEALGPADGHFDETMREPTEAGGPSEYPQSEAVLDQGPEDLGEEVEAYRKRRRDEADEDLEFPDEIELPPNVNARERLARYRGLKSLRTSVWNREEDKMHEPTEWGRLLDIADYKSAKHRVMKEALTGGVRPGTRVQVHLRISDDQKPHLLTLPCPTALFSLLRHEHKHSAVQYSILLPSDYPAPLKSKEQLIVQCGPRRLAINPLFSQAGNTPNNVHKFDRYLHPGHTAVASFIGPVIWGSVPCLFFRPGTPTAPGPTDTITDLAHSMSDASRSPARLNLIATGTSLPPSTSRVIAKRIVLTGHPYKIHKRVVTVRYMFFNDADVEYFGALQLWTKRGRSGFVKETLGTHGYFKATFDGKVNPLDAVAVSLYKRMWPREAHRWISAVGPMEEEGPELVEAGDGMLE